VRSTLLASTIVESSAMRAAHWFGSKVSVSSVRFLVMRYRMVASAGLY